jgi:DNA helicase-2/ATP-dependent DNA helicase PcrA
MENRSPSDVELSTCARLEALCGAAWERRPAARCLGYLRVRSGGRIRDLILGGESFVAGAVALLDWERAPLAEVFLAHERGDEYELELDERHSVEGTVLARAILRTRVVPDTGSRELVEIDDGEVCLRREAGGWNAGPSRLRPPMALREPALRGRQSSPIEVELDAEQRRGVELVPSRSLLILGEAGFGKTTVALHRIAHLRALARAEGRPFAALVLVPTRGLQRLVVALLERLDVRDVEVRSFARWAAREGRRVFPDLPARDSEDAPIAVSRVKRHVALREVLPEIVRGTAAMREVEAGYRDDETVRSAEQLLHLFGDRALLERVAVASAGALTPRMVEQVLAHTRVLFTPTTEHALAHVDADRLRTVDGRAIDAGTPLQDAETIDPEDFAVLFELLFLRTGGATTAQAALARYDHIVVDEAQEFAAIELALIGRARAPGGSITVAGDEHQQVDETIAFTSWPQVVTELGVTADCEKIVLRESYRCPPVVEAFARTLFDSLPGSSPAPADPALTFSPAAHELELVSVLITALLELRQHDRLASVAVVCRFAASARRMYGLLAKALTCRLVVDGDFRFGPGISVTCIDEVKGLEFDYVILPDTTAANYPDNAEARRALYVGVTRAIARVWLLWSGRGSPLVEGSVSAIPRSSRTSA